MCFAVLWSLLTGIVGVNSKTLSSPPFSSSEKSVAPAAKLSGLPAVLKKSIAIAAL